MRSLSLSLLNLAFGSLKLKTKAQLLNPSKVKGKVHRTKNADASDNPTIVPVSAMSLSLSRPPSTSRVRFFTLLEVCAAVL